LAPQEKDVRVSRYVFDSYALLAYYQDEPGAERVEQLDFDRAHEHAITTINLGEIYYITAKRTDLLNAEEILQDVLRLPLRIITPGFALTIEAARIKGNHALSYADCFAAVVAQEFGAAVVTGDREFERIEDLVDIEWLPPGTQTS
jgi:predicted nucleic acid-binding protein